MKKFFLIIFILSIFSIAFAAEDDDGPPKGPPLQLEKPDSSEISAIKSILQEIQAKIDYNTQLLEHSNISRQHYDTPSTMNMPPRPKSLNSMDDGD